MDIDEYINSLLIEVWSETHCNILKRIGLRMIGIRQITSIYVTQLETNNFDEDWVERKALSHWHFDGNKFKQIEDISEEELDKKHHFSTTPTIEYFVNEDQTQIAVAVYRGYSLNAEGHREQWDSDKSMWKRTYTWIA